MGRAFLVRWKNFGGRTAPSLLPQPQWPALAGVRMLIHDELSMPQAGQLNDVIDEAAA
jgi:hypothetical protein